MSKLIEVGNNIDRLPENESRCNLILMGNIPDDERLVFNNRQKQFGNLVIEHGVVTKNRWATMYGESVNQCFIAENDEEIIIRFKKRK